MIKDPDCGWPFWCKPDCESCKQWEAMQADAVEAWWAERKGNK